MATRNWALVKDTNVLQITGAGTLNEGNGNDQHAPIGLMNSGGTTFVFRYFSQYAVDTSGMASISSAILHVKASNQTHIAFGSSPSLHCYRVTSSWVGSGGSEGTWSLTANPKWDTQPSTDSTGGTTTNMTRTPGAWDTIDVTAIVNAWAFLGSPNYGIRLAAVSEASTADAWEAWADASSFPPYIAVTYVPTSVVNPPTVTPIRPLTGALADVAYAAGSGWASPRTTLSWSFSDPDLGQVQSAYQVVIYNDAGGSPGTTFYDSGKVTSPFTALQVPATFVQGNYYHWKAQVWDSTNTPSTSYSALQRFRTQWGAAEYIFDMTTAPLAWSVPTINTQGTVVIEYNSTSATGDPGAGLGPWQPDIALVVKQRYARYRVWLLPANAIDPHLDKLVIQYSTAALPTLDNWTFSAHAVADAATRVYGVQSLRIDSVGVDERTYQLVKVEPNTTYQLSGRIKQSAIGVNPFITLGSTTTGGDLVSAPASPTTTDWTEVGVEWFSGAATQVYVQCGASGTGTTWFDTLKLEASIVSTQWAPALLNKAVVVDASGLKVDASLGATVRLRGSTGGTRDLVELGPNGLQLGGSVQVSSPAANQFSIGLAGVLMQEITAPSNPAADQGILFLKDNGSGKTQLCIIFNTGAAIVIATQA